MLEKLVIKNIALIENAEIIFTNGLNVLSGETGAGKSVIIDSLNFVLGAKADKTLIRSGEIECSVRAEFDVSNNHSIRKLFSEFDLDEEDVLIINRKFTADGKSSIKINGATATVGILKAFTSALVDVHGQSEHFNLLKESNQLSLIDCFGGDEIKKLKSQIADCYGEYKKIIKSIDSFGGDEAQRLIKLDILNYQINEIENCNIYENEEEELLAKKQKIIHQEKILNALNAVKSAVNEEGGVCDLLNYTVKMLNNIVDFGEEYSSLYERIDSAFSELEDIADCAGGLIEEVDLSETDPNFIEERLERIKSIKNKYGSDYSEIYRFLQSAKQEKDRLENFNENVQKLTEEKNAAQKQLYDLYCALNKLRISAAENFEANVLKELQELGMPKAQFKISFKDAPSFLGCKYDSANGFDVIEFYFSANFGEPLKPLSMVISGGEMSRFMLAIKAQTAKYNEISTFIFDEIDAGISGKTAKVVAEKFAKIARSVQIVAISHLPQVSAMADNNLLIEKKELGGKTITFVKQLSAEEKINEILRLVGGGSDSPSAITHSKEMIDSALKYKEQIKQKPDL